MSATILLVPLVLGLAGPEKEVTDAEKKAFFAELAKLPTRGEFFTDEAVRRAIPYTRVLLALTERDLEKRDLYPFLALSGGLLQHKGPRQYAAAHFRTIAHPTLKLAWATGLFERNEAASEVIPFLRRALASRETAPELSRMLGPHFEELKWRVVRADEARKQTSVELVKVHSLKAFAEYGGGLSYTRSTSAFAPGQLLYAVRPLKQRGELCVYHLTEGTTTRLAVPQPKGFTPDREFATYFDNPALAVSEGGDLLCRWAIKGNGDHGLALLRKGTRSFQVRRVKLALAECHVLAAPDGTWYLVQWSGWAGFTVYRLDAGLNLERLGTFQGRGHHTVGILAARLIGRDVLHLFWADVLSDNHLRMRCVDFDLRERKWRHDREVFRLDRFVSDASGPTVLQLPDGGLRYLWRVTEGAQPGPATGLYYQSEADGKAVRFTDAQEYAATADGDRIVVCYTRERSPEKVFFRVLRHGTPGPETAIVAARGREHNLSSEYLLLYSEGDRAWFVNTLAPNTLYELRLVDTDRP